MESELNIAEIPYPDGERIKCRYSRYFAPTGDRWIRHGLFRSYHENGSLQSEGYYHHGLEEGVWRDFHENGCRAAEGTYEGGREIGEWRYWNPSGAYEGSELKSAPKPDSR